MVWNGILLELGQGILDHLRRMPAGWPGSAPRPWWRRWRWGRRLRFFWKAHLIAAEPVSTLVPIGGELAPRKTPGKRLITRQMSG